MENRSNFPAQEKDKKSRVLLYSIIGVLLTLNLGLLYMWRKGDKDKTQVQGQLVTEQKINMEKERLLMDARSLLAKYQADSVQLASKNVAISAELAGKKEELSRLVAKMQREKNSSESDKRDLKKKIEEMQAYIAKLEQENTELKEINNKLELSNQAQKEELTAAAQKNATLQKEAQRLKSIAERLKAASMRVDAMKKKFMSEKEGTTDKAGSAEVLRIIMKVAENNEAAEGPRTLYVKVTGPEGVTIANPGNESGKMMYDGKESLYTYSIPFVFERAEKEFTSRWKPINGFRKGNYNIEIYTEGYMIGSAKLNLK
ncbi:MAG: hypothetical protein RLZZ370_438 [Bacteroidota bacterium]|jgi:hypothetical protein